MKNYFLLIILLVFIFGCSKDLPFNYQRDDPPEPPPTTNGFKLKTIEPSILEGLRQDSLFKEMVRLSAPSRFHHDLDSVKEMCGENTKLFDSIFRRHNDAIFSDVLTYYEKNKKNYPPDFLFYVLCESGSLLATKKTRSLDIEDVIINGFTPEHVWKTMEALRNRLITTSDYVLNGFRKQVLRHHTSGCGCHQLSQYEIIMNNFCEVARSSIPQGMPLLMECLYYSDCLSSPIDQGRIKDDFAGIEYRLKVAGQIEDKVSLIISELDIIANYHRIFIDNVVYDLSCKDMGGGGSSGGGSGSGGAGSGGAGGGAGGEVTPPNPDDKSEQHRIIKQNAPKASKIINLNSDLTIDQWKEIEAVLNEMVGIDKIIEGIRLLGGDNIIELTINPGAESQLNGWKMTLRKISYGDVAEEFFHAYQRAMNGPPTISNGLSREFEAKIYTYFSGNFSGNAQFLTIPEGECFDIFNLWESENSDKIEIGEPISPMSTEDYTRMMQAYKENTGSPYCEMGYDPNYGFGLAMDLFK